jgi:S-adenosylmethionine decarboxylase
MDTLGRHLLAEYYGCDRELLNDEKALAQLLKRAAEAANVTVLGSIEHSFSPVGVTCVLAIEESHISLHTWPEEGYAAADFFTCGDGKPEEAHRVLATGLGSTETEALHLKRGLRTERMSIRMISHERS